MNNKVRNGIIFLVIAALYFGFIYYDNHKPQTGESPVIKVPTGTLKIKASADEKKTTKALLKGVKATDKEDGNITKNIKIIENTVNTFLSSAFNFSLFSAVFLIFMFI